MPADYTARPLDDPSLIGKGVPFELGWKSEKINSTAKSPTKLPTVSGPRRLNDPASVIKKFQVAFQFYASWHQPAISQQEALALLRDQVRTQSLMPTALHCTIRRMAPLLSTSTPLTAKSSWSQLCTAAISAAVQFVHRLTPTHSKSPAIPVCTKPAGEFFLTPPLSVYKLVGGPDNVSFGTLTDLVLHFAKNPYRIDQTGHPRKLRSINSVCLPCTSLLQ